MDVIIVKLPRYEDAGISEESIKELYLGALNTPLLIPAKSNLAIIATLRIIFAAPLQSAFILIPVPVLNKPLLVLIPLLFHPSG